MSCSTPSHDQKQLDAKAVKRGHTASQQEPSRQATLNFVSSEAANLPHSSCSKPTRKKYKATRTTCRPDAPRPFSERASYCPRNDLGKTSSTSHFEGITYTITGLPSRRQPSYSLQDTETTLERDRSNDSSMRPDTKKVLCRQHLSCRRGFEVRRLGGSTSEAVIRCLQPRTRFLPLLSPWGISAAKPCPHSTKHGPAGRRKTDQR